jgi:membrane-associated protein
MNPLSRHDLIAFLLLTAGLLIATTSSGLHLSLVPVLLLSAAGALLGAQVGFWIGRRLERYGVGKAVVLARFRPIVRTVSNPIIAVVVVVSLLPIAAELRRGGAVTSA